MFFVHRSFYNMRIEGAEAKRELSKVPR
jgi:hypothetical protein